MDLIDFNKKDALKKFKEDIKQEYKNFRKKIWMCLNRQKTKEQTNRVLTKFYTKS